MEFLFEIYFKLTSPFSGLLIQDRELNHGNVDFFDSKGTDPALQLYVLTGLAVIIFVLCYGLYRYIKLR